MAACDKKIAAIFGGQGAIGAANGFDGDGQRVKTAFQDDQSSASSTKYYLRSSVLGGKVIAEILSSGQKVQGYVYASDQLMAIQKLAVAGDSSAYVVWNHEEPSGSARGTDESGGQNWAAALNSAERDATGVDMNLEDPGPEPLNTLLTDENNPDIHAMGNPARLSGGCTFNHMPIPDCGFLLGGISLDRFNLISVASEASKPRLLNYDMSYINGKGQVITTDYGLNGNLAYAMAAEMSGSLTKNWMIEDNSPYLSIAQTQQPLGPVRAGLGPPHNAKYENCKGLADIPEEAASLVMDASRREGADPTLIAVTMKRESTFGRNLAPNPRKDDEGNYTGYFDVGWMQTANDPAVWNKSPYTDGLPNAYGTIAADATTR